MSNTFREIEHALAGLPLGHRIGVLEKLLRIQLQAVHDEPDQESQEPVDLRNTWGPSVAMPSAAQRAGWETLLKTPAPVYPTEGRGPNEKIE
jgi:hypothetical protein